MVSPVPHHVHIERSCSDADDVNIASTFSHPNSQHVLVPHCQVLYIMVSVKAGLSSTMTVIGEVCDLCSGPEPVLRRHHAATESIRDVVRHHLHGTTFESVHIKEDGTALDLWGK